MAETTPVIEAAGLQDELERAGIHDRRGMNVHHRPHSDAVAALCAVLDPNCCR